MNRCKHNVCSDFFVRSSAAAGWRLMKVFISNILISRQFCGNHPSFVLIKDIGTNHHWIKYYLQPKYLVQLMNTDFHIIIY